MPLHSPEAYALHEELYDQYKRRLSELERPGEEEKEEPFERSFIHNAIFLHSLWFEQVEERSADSKAPLLEEILEQRESDLGTFQEWMTGFAKDAKPNGWAIWGWSFPLKTFVGFPVRSHDEAMPIGVTPILVIDCWEHSYLLDFGNDFDAYIDSFWSNLDWQVIETRHQELANLLGFNIK